MLKVSYVALRREMSQTQASAKGPRKRVSSGQFQEERQSRKKVAETSNEDYLTTSDIRIEIKKARQKSEQEARDSGARVEKRSRMIKRFPCCACKEDRPSKSDGSCSGCEHMPCAECIILRSK